MTSSAVSGAHKPLPEDGVQIVEVGPRDGLQNEFAHVPAATKVELVRRLIASGLPTVEVTSFVSPKAVPQLADGDDVLRAVLGGDTRGAHLPVLVPNERGYERARDAGATSIALFTAASESFNQRNIGASIAESIERFRPVVERAAADGVHVRGYVSTAFGCPFEGPVDDAAVDRVCAQLVELGITDLSIGDTIGVATPADVARVMRPLVDAYGTIELALHLHDTRGMAIANARAGLDLGIRRFDSSVAGLGGCPFAPGATGNLATEDLVWFCEREGMRTGVDLESLVETAQWISAELDRPLSGHIARARLWPWKGAS